MDDTNAVAWGAIGINQQLSNRWSVTVYAGAARESDPDNVKPLTKQAIFVVNQETQYKFNAHWQLLLGLSFRSQERYQEQAPYEPQHPAFRDEARYYLRLYYRHNVGKVAMIYSLRPEYRSFYNTRWHTWDKTPLELRFRLKVQAAIPLNELKSNQFIVGNELLSATDYERGVDRSLHWSHYAFTEDRFTTYFRHIFKKPSLIVDLGLMHQVKFDNGERDYIAHLAFDVLFLNPFGTKKVSR